MQVCVCELRAYVTVCKFVCTLIYMCLSTRKYVYNYMYKIIK